MGIPEEVGKNCDEGSSPLEIGSEGVAYNSGLGELAKGVIEKIGSSGHHHSKKSAKDTGIVAGFAGSFPAAFAEGEYLLHSLPECAGASPDLKCTAICLAVYGCTMGAMALGGGKVGKKIAGRLNERQETKRTGAIGEVNATVEKFQELGREKQKQYDSLSPGGSDVGISASKYNELEKKVVDGYNACMDGLSRKVPVLRGEGKDLRVRYVRV